MATQSESVSRLITSRTCKALLNDVRISSEAVSNANFYVSEFILALLLTAPKLSTLNIDALKVTVMALLGEPLAFSAVQVALTAIQTDIATFTTITVINYDTMRGYLLQILQKHFPALLSTGVDNESITTASVFITAVVDTLVKYIFQAVKTHTAVAHKDAIRVGEIAHILSRDPCLSEVFRLINMQEMLDRRTYQENHSHQITSVSPVFSISSGDNDTLSSSMSPQPRALRLQVSNEPRSTSLSQEPLGSQNGKGSSFDDLLVSSSTKKIYLAPARLKNVEPHAKVVALHKHSPDISPNSAKSSPNLEISQSSDGESIHSGQSFARTYSPQYDGPVCTPVSSLTDSKREYANCQSPSWPDEDVDSSEDEYPKRKHRPGDTAQSLAEFLSSNEPPTDWGTPTVSKEKKTLMDRMRFKLNKEKTKEHSGERVSPQFESDSYLRREESQSSRKSPGYLPKSVKLSRSPLYTRTSPDGRTIVNEQSLPMPLVDVESERNLQSLTGHQRTIEQSNMDHSSRLSPQQNPVQSSPTTYVQKPITPSSPSPMLPKVESLERTIIRQREYDRVPILSTAPPARSMKKNVNNLSMSTGSESKSSSSNSSISISPDHKSISIQPGSELEEMSVSSLSAMVISLRTQLTNSQSQVSSVLSTVEENKSKFDALALKAFQKINQLMADKEQVEQLYKDAANRVNLMDMSLHSAHDRIKLLERGLELEADSSKDLRNYNETMQSENQDLKDRLDMVIGVISQAVPAMKAVSDQS